MPLTAREALLVELHKARMLRLDAIQSFGAGSSQVRNINARILERVTQLQ